MSRISYGLVRNRDGMPKVDNPQSVPDEIWQGFSKKEKDFANANRKEGNIRND